MTEFNKIFPDLLEEHTLSEDVGSGYSCTRKFALSNVHGNTTQRAFNALNDPRIPKLKTAHPSIAKIKVTNKTANVSPADPNIITVNVEYGILEDAQQEVDEAVFSIGTTASTEETNYAYGKNNPDNPGSPVVTSDIKEKMVIKHRYGQSRDYLVKNIVPKIQREFPSGVVTFARTEPKNPMQNKRRFEGTVNKGTFLGDPERTWLCSRINGSTRDGGKTWQVEYEFQYKAEKWDITLFYEDPDDGKVPLDAKPHIFTPFRADDFALLAIPQTV